jgi:hypothetical protein
MPQKRKNIKKRLNIVLLCGFLIWFIAVFLMPLDWFLWGVPQISWNMGGRFSDFQLLGDKYDTPLVSYSFSINFTAKGSFSLNNPIKIDLILQNVSLPNFLEGYQAVVFSDSFDYPSKKYNPDGSLDNAKIYLKNIGNDTYQGEGTVIWMSEGPVYGPVVVDLKSTINLPIERVQQFPNVLTISGVSDTLAQTYTESTLKASVMLSSFSLLILQPVLEAIFLKKEEK